MLQRQVEHLLQTPVDIDRVKGQGNARWGVRLDARQGGFDRGYGGYRKCIPPPASVGAGVTEERQHKSRNYGENEKEKINEERKVVVEEDKHYQSNTGVEPPVT